MSLLAPPPSPPRVALDDNDGLRRMHLRLWLILMTMLTVFVTVWVCTLGVIPAIIAVMVAKHVLVAILMRGLGVDATNEMSV